MSNQGPECIGVYPKIIDEDDELACRIRADEIDSLFDERDFRVAKKSEEQKIRELSEYARMRYSQTGNVYHAISAFLEFCDRRLYPPPWSLKVIYEALSRHMRSPDPALFASQFGVSGKVRGAKSRYQEYTQSAEREFVLTEMVALLNGFDITLTDAARAIIAREDLDISAKRLSNQFNEEFGSPKKWMLKNRDYDAARDPFCEDQYLRSEYISDFPRHVRNLLKDKRPK